jgi:hypothetical protein
MNGRALNEKAIEALPAFFYRVLDHLRHAKYPLTPPSPISSHTLLVSRSHPRRIIILKG